MDNERKNKYNPYHPGYSFRAEFLYTLHLILIITFIVLAFVAPLGAVICTAVFHRALFIYNKGCIINQLERKVCGNPQYDFFQEFICRLTGKHIGKEGSKGLDVLLVTSIVVIAILSFSYRFFRNGSTRNR